jgi:hypothetical protein
VTDIPGVTFTPRFYTRTVLLYGQHTEFSSGLNILPCHS